jgi:hypothetical protein
VAIGFVPTLQVRTYGPGAAAPIPFRATGVEFVKVGPSRSLSADIHLNMLNNRYDRMYRLARSVEMGAY